MTKSYSIYHLNISSGIPLTEPFQESHPAEGFEPDIIISTEPHISTPEPKPWFEVVGEQHVRLRIEDQAIIEIKEGQHIRVQMRHPADESLIRLYLLGSAMGCILHQRGLIPLHISTVCINGQAWGFTAPSGTGKSTLAARLHHFAGCPMVSDDVAALYLIDGQPFVAGGPPLMKLQPEFAALFTDATISPIPYPESNKLKVQPKNAFIQGLVPLAGIVVLERDETQPKGSLEIEPLRGAEAFMGAREAIYRHQMGLAMSSQAHMFNKLTELTTHVPFYRGKLGQWTIDDGGATETAIVERLATLTK